MTTPGASTGVSSRSRDLVVQLKRENDPRDVGRHDAELHGRALDASTGEPLAIAWTTLRTNILPEGTGFDLIADLVPNHLFLAPVQTAMFGEPPAPEKEFHLVGLEGRRTLLLGSFPDRGLAVAGPFELQGETVVSGIELAVHAPAEVVIVVRDGAGRPVPDAWVFMTGVGPYSAERVAAIDTAYRAVDGRGVFFEGGGQRTDADGRVRFDALPHGVRCRFAAVGPATRPGLSELVETRAGATRELEVRVSLD